MTDPLTTIAIQHGTDKFGYHDYTPIYFRLLNPRRHSALRFLEIGIGGYGDAERGGGSLATWRDFFPQGSIVGIDIERKTLDLGERVAVLQGSQVDADFLADVVATHGPFDVILDDGSHRNDHVLTSFQLLWSGLAPHGIYIIEDVQTAFFPEFGGSLDLTPPNSVGFFAGLFATLGEQDLAGVARFHNLIMLFKTSAPPVEAMHDDVVTVRAPAATLEQEVLRAIDEASGNPLIRAIPTDAATSSAPFKSWFVDIDHREKAIHFPEAATSPTAERISGLFRTREAWWIEFGDNSYPSNFAFDLEHPRVRDAMEQMKTVLASSTQEQGLVSFVEMLVSVGRDEEARPYLERLLSAEACSKRFFHLAGSMLWKDADWQRAAELYRRAVELFPAMPDYWTRLGWALSKMDRNAEASEILVAGVAAIPDHPYLRWTFGVVLARADRPDEAVTHLRLAIQLEPGHAARHRFLGEILMKTGDLESALAALRDAAALDEDSARTHQSITRCLRLMGRDHETPAQ